MRIIHANRWLSWQDWKGRGASRTLPRMLEIEHLSLSVPTDEGAKPAVSDVSLHLAAGRVVGLVGESGCGKTLTAQAVLRLGEAQGVICTAGRILLDGHDILTMDETALRRVRGRRIAMIFQEPMSALNPVFTIGEQMGDVIRLHLGLSRQQARERAMSLLRDVGLHDPATLLDQYPDALSGGMRQRVLIAMAMSPEPDYLIADEPTTALDVSVQARIVELLKAVQQRRQLGMLLVTHDFGLVAELADTVAVMYAGHIVESGEVGQLFDAPAHPYTRALMACRPEAARRGHELPVIPGQVPAPGDWPSGCRFAPRCGIAQADCGRPVPPDAWQQPGHCARCLHVGGGK